MKNQRILIIASFLLVLCVFEKEARNKAIRTGNVEKIYNIQEAVENIDPISTQNDLEVRDGGKSLYNPSSMMQFASMDTTTNNASTKLLTQSLLIPAEANF